MSRTEEDRQEAAAALPKRHGRAIPEGTELSRLTARAWAAYLEQVNARPLLPIGATETEEGAVIRDGHKRQLLRAVSFALTAGTAPERIKHGEQTELHRIFSTDPDASDGYHWHEDKHPDALALYIELCGLEHL